MLYANRVATKEIDRASEHTKIRVDQPEPLSRLSEVTYCPVLDEPLYPIYQAFGSCRHSGRPDWLPLA